MSMDEVNFDAPVAKKRKAPKAKRTKPTGKAASPVSATGERFPGLTRTMCADGCNKNGCVISGGPYCGHPTKGAQINQNDPAAVRRLQMARDQIGVRIDPDRFK